MESRTSDLLRLLADEQCSRIIRTLSAGPPRTEQSIAEMLGAKRPTVNRKLSELRTWGVLGVSDGLSGGAGRTPKVWRLRSQRAAELLDEADRFTGYLLERQAREHREATAGPRLRIVPQVDDGVGESSRG